MASKTNAFDIDKPSEYISNVQKIYESIGKGSITIWADKKDIEAGCKVLEISLAPIYADEAYRDTMTMRMKVQTQMARITAVR